MRPISRPGFKILALLMLALATLQGCKSFREREKQSDPDVLYDQARIDLKNQNFEEATKNYEALQARFPFSDAARQGRLDLMYAYYKSHQPEQAVDNAEQFIRENPTHPKVAYAYYVKGLAYFEGYPGRLSSRLNLDLATRPPTDALKSFAAFQELVQKFPQSEYAHDARQRMIYLRNRLCDYEVSVANYYLRRGAWVAALARAKYAIETYDGAPSVEDALQIMITCYQKLEMPALVEQTERVFKENFPEGRASELSQREPWWKFW